MLQLYASQLVHALVDYVQAYLQHVHKRTYIHAHAHVHVLNYVHVHVACHKTHLFGSRSPIN